MPPSGMARTAANAKPDTNIMKRARSFSNNRALQHPHTQPVEHKQIPAFQPPNRAQDFRKQEATRPSTQAIERAMMKNPSQERGPRTSSQQAIERAQQRASTSAMERAQKYLNTRNSVPAHMPSAQSNLKQRLSSLQRQQQQPSQRQHQQ